MSWFYLAMICALSLALADVYTKKYFCDYSGVDILLVRLGIPGILLLPFTVYFGISDLPIEFWYYAIVLVPLEIAAMWLYVLAIRDAPLYLTLPYLSFTPVFNIAVGYIILNETVDMKGGAGILLVVIGSYLLNLDQFNQSGSGLFAPLTAIYKLKNSRLMLIAAAIYSLTSVLSKRAMQYSEPAVFGAHYYTLVGMAFLSIMLFTQPEKLQLIRKRTKANLVVGSYMAIMIATHFLAIAQIEAAYMIAVKRTSVIFGMLLGAWMFKEIATYQHFTAAILMVTGVFFILV